MVASAGQIQKLERRDVLSENPNPVYIGYILLALSFAIHLVYESMHSGAQDQNNLTLFFVHYFLALTYMIILLVHKSFGIRKSWKKENINRTVIILNLFLVSAFALNREIHVFYPSSQYLSAYLVLSSIVLLSYRYFQRLPTWVNSLQHFLLGTCFVLYTYLVLAAGKSYILAGFGILAFGIGGHIMVPLTLLTASVLLFRYHYKSKPVSPIWPFAGLALIITIVSCFIAVWTRRISKIESLTYQSVLFPGRELPSWVKVAENFPDDWISDRLLRADVDFAVPDSRNNFQSLDLPADRRWDELQHDPLVYLASSFKTLTLPEEDRLRILLALYGNRHEVTERLWSGENLSTSYIVSDIDIYPAYRLAYTEKYFNIRNTATNRGWSGTEEAIYTLQLPEGSVISSLSLWINGKEEKGILTSKQKATKAYKTIVGVEARDPSVVHWQEGNRVTVRVFPCTSQEERKFKLGITTPLCADAGEIRYRNIDFLGPQAKLAKETIRIRVIGDQQNLILPSSFTRNSEGNFVRETGYDPDFTIVMKSTPLAKDGFSFDGFTYKIEEQIASPSPASIENIYLDLNSAWTDDEIAHARRLLNYFKVYAYENDTFTTVTSRNFTTLTNHLQSKHFSLFPYHMVPDADHTLVITKGKLLSVHLSDFKQSAFATTLTSFFASGKKIKAYNLGNETSTYTATLRELRSLEYASGSIFQLEEWLKENKFPASVESENKVVLYDARLAITRSKTEKTVQPSTAPDHLLRLFAYNDILRQVGPNYFAEDFVNEKLVQQASKAYVVSPVSSLIVLESKEDYKRFDIADQGSSLLKAAKQSTGAVPEPHEWALIGVLLCFILYTIHKRKLRAVL